MYLYLLYKNRVICSVKLTQIKVNAIFREINPNHLHIVEKQFHEKFRQIKFRNTFLRPQIHKVYYLGINSLVTSLVKMLI